MKKFLIILLSIFLVSCSTHTQINNEPQDTSKTKDTNTKVEETMKLYINDEEIPVIWEDNDSINEMQNELKNNDIVVDMSMYSNNEQVGCLNKTYISHDKRMTTSNGDIVLYSSNQIVVFYAPNTWEYTKLGKIDLTSEKVTQLLSNGDVTITITCA